MGKNKYIETPEKMWELFEEYVKHKRANPRKIDKATGSGKVVQESLRVPLTMSGFRAFGHSKGVTVVHYFANTDDSYSEYRTICSRIEDEIRNDQIEGGMVGQYNASITQRLNGLTEKTENVNNNKTISEINFNLVEKRKDD